MEKSYCEIENSEMRTQLENGKNWSVRRGDWLDDIYGIKKKQFDKTLLNAGVNYTDTSGGGGGLGVGNRKKDVQSWMWEHSRDCHGGRIGENGNPNYEFRVTAVFKKCLQPNNV